MLITSLWVYFDPGGTKRVMHSKMWRVTKLQQTAVLVVLISIPNAEEKEIEWKEPTTQNTQHPSND